jgi:hypothetical protein
MRVAELGAGGGVFFFFLLHDRACSPPRRRLAPTGKVVGASTPRLILERFADKPWSERLAKPVMANVRARRPRVRRSAPARRARSDAVLIVLFYHDTSGWASTGERMNRAVSPPEAGGRYVVVDHSGRSLKGSGADRRRRRSTASS